MQINIIEALLNSLDEEEVIYGNFNSFLAKVMTFKGYAERNKKDIQSLLTDYSNLEENIEKAGFHYQEFEKEILEQIAYLKKIENFAQLQLDSYNSILSLLSFCKNPYFGKKSDNPKQSLVELMELTAKFEDLQDGTNSADKLYKIIQAKDLEKNIIKCKLPSGVTMPVVIDSNRTTIGEISERLTTDRLSNFTYIDSRKYINVGKEYHENISNVEINAQKNQSKINDEYDMSKREITVNNGDYFERVNGDVIKNNAQKNQYIIETSKFNGALQDVIASLREANVKDEDLQEIEKTADEIKTANNPESAKSVLERVFEKINNALEKVGKTIDNVESVMNKYETLSKVAKFTFDASKKLWKLIP